LLELSTIHDFEQACELWPADQLRTQLGAGRFTARILQSRLGKIQYRVEHNSRDIEMEAHMKKDLFAFGVVIDYQRPFKRDGMERDLDTVSITPPHACLHTVFPANGTFAVVFADPAALFANVALSAEAADWLAGLKQRGVLIRSPWLARRLREDARHVLEHSVASQTRENEHLLEQAAMASLASALSFELLLQRQRAVLGQPAFFGDFWAVRNAMLREVDRDAFDPFDLAGVNKRSRRFIEAAFARSIGIGPMRYLRILRLHKARQKLLDQKRSHSSIGDIAAEEGFWDWSRFTSYYRRQFNELPSETRMRSL